MGLWEDKVDTQSPIVGTYEFFGIKNTREKAYLNLMFQPLSSVSGAIKCKKKLTITYEGFKK